MSGWHDLCNSWLMKRKLLYINRQLWTFLNATITKSIIMYCIVIILLQISASIGQKTQCVQYDILDFKITSIPLPSIMYSGITPNNPGQIEQCINSNYSYYLVFIKNTTLMSQSFRGLCMPNQCTATDIQIALQFLHCRVYDSDDLKIVDNVAEIGAFIVLSWVLVLLVCSCYVSLKEPIINQYLVGEQQQTNVDAGLFQNEHSTLALSEIKDDNINIFNYRKGYRRIFQYSNKKNPLSLILFLTVVSFAVSIQFSYRQNIAHNTNETYQVLNNGWGIMICNTQITLHTIIFIMGVRLSLSIEKLKKFGSLIRQFFEMIIKKWLILILMSLFVYSISNMVIDEPLSKIWKDSNGKHCSQYIWQIWFLFRNLQLDGKICLPWFSLMQSDLLFTIMATPLILIFKVSKKSGYILIFLLMATSIVISYAILKDQLIIFQPVKLMNSQKQFNIDYQGNAFVRMGAFYLGLFFGFLINEGMLKKNEISVQKMLCQKVSEMKAVQWLLTVVGLIMMVVCSVLILPYLDIQNPQKLPILYMILSPLGFVFGLGLFILPISWEGSASTTKLISKLIGWQGWTHLDKISVIFYLITPMVIGCSTYSSQNSIYYDMETIVAYLLGDLITIYFISILIVAAFQNQLIPIVSWLQVKVLGQQAHFSNILVQQI